MQPPEESVATTKRIKLTELTPDNLNANKGSPRASGMLERSIQSYGAGRSVLVDKAGRIIAGNKTVEASNEVGIEDAIMVETDGRQLVVVKRTDLDLDSPEGRGLAIADNRVAEVGLNWDEDNLRLIGEELDLGEFFFEDELQLLNLDSPDSEGEVEGLTDEDAVPEVQAQAVSALGDLWLLGDHRVLCGDSTSAEDVARLMNGERAALLHADPPYGMGKEGEGVANDNLYREKLDVFQMQWWAAFRTGLEDNASAYIWGNPEDLWRLWYAGGLRNSERLTFRNEVVWDKGHGMGMNSEAHRQFATATERALFFMLGEQGFNHNADNYWEGWEPIRAYLKAERDSTGWNNKTVASFFGFHPRMADHWFSESQWSFIRREQYERLQAEAKGKAFQREYEDLKREYEDLKREFYESRAHFDNTHDNMTDVWSFGRVEGEERYGHATPKPVDIMRRVMLSSLKGGGLCAEPFAGSGSTLMACEVSGRRCFTMELLPQWVDVIVRRWQDYTGKAATLEDGCTFDEVKAERTESDA